MRSQLNLRTIVGLALLGLAFVGASSQPAFAFGGKSTGGDHKTPPPAKKPEPVKKPAPAKKPEGAKPAEKPAEAKRIAVGGEADASLTLMDVAGKTQSLKDYRGKVTVIEFWSLDPASAAWDKKLAKTIEDFGKKNVSFLVVDCSKGDFESGETPNKRIIEYAAKNGITCPIVLDKQTQWAERFGASQTGEVFVLDAKGVLKYRGAIDDDAKGEKGDKRTQYLANALEAVMGGKDPSPATTTASGAPIKLEKMDGKPAEAGGPKPTPPKK